jgi:uncharacterized protein (TIGR00251 family)
MNGHSTRLAGIARRGKWRAEDRVSWQNAADMRLDVYIQPRASKTELAGMHGGSIKIRVAAPPVENAANQALIEFIAERLGIAKRCVRVVSGAASRKKILEIDGVSADTISATLRS